MILATNESGEHCLEPAGEGRVVASTVPQVGLGLGLGTGPGVGGAFLAVVADLDVLGVGVENGLVSAETIIALKGCH